MKETLSQQEIDTLLNALSSGELDPEEIEKEEERNKIRVYDFRRPIKLSKEYINTLYMIFENFAKMAANILSTQVHTNVNMSLGAVEQISYDEFLHSIPNPTLLGVFNSKPLSGNQVIEVNPQFCTQIIELMCGGDEQTVEIKKESFTEIELGILEEVVLSLLRSFEAAWSDVVEIDTQLDYLETNTQLLQNMSPNEPVILTSLTVEIFNEKSFINICIPYVSFENIVDKLSIKNWFDFEKENDELNSNTDILADKIKLSQVELKVLLGKATITVNDFVHLEEGDIVRLDGNTSNPLKMYVEDKFHFFVKPGQIKDKMAVGILQFVEEDVDE